MQNLKNLLEDCLKNDRKAQKELYEKYFQFLMSICFRYERNHDDAVALVNETFYKTITHLKKFDLSKPFIPWIKRIAINECLDHLRRKKTIYNSIVFLDDDAWENEKYTDDDINADENGLTYHDYLEMMDALDEPGKTIFNLYAIDGFTHKQIAEELNISERTSKRYLAKSREVLKQMIIAKNVIMKGA